MAGAGLALNLAYINLERFRYRSKIRLHARKELERLKSKGGAEIPEEFIEIRNYKLVKYLSALPDNDADIAKRGDKSEEKNNEEVWPEGLWPKIYKYLFDKHQDRIFSFLMVIVSTFLLVVGVAHSIGHAQCISCLFSNEWILLSFYILVASVIFPMFFVMLGTRVVRWGTDIASENVAELEKMMQGVARQARIKEQPEN